MNYQDTINKIKVLFEIAAPVTSPDVSGLSDYILQDGTKISCDKLEVGGLVTINGTPAPDGEHKLQDGSMIQTKDGIINEITSPAADMNSKNVDSDLKKKEDEMAISTEMGKKMEEMAVKMQSVETKCTAYENKMAETEAEMKKQKEAITMLTQMIEKLATMPVDQPAAMSTNQFTAQKNEDKNDKFQSIVDAIKRIKNN